MSRLTSPPELVYSQQRSHRTNYWRFHRGELWVVEIFSSIPSHAPPLTILSCRMASRRRFSALSTTLPRRSGSDPRLLTGSLTLECRRWSCPPHRPSPYLPAAASSSWEGTCVCECVCVFAYVHVYVCVCMCTYMTLYECVSVCVCVCAGGQ